MLHGFSRPARGRHCRRGLQSRPLRRFVSCVNNCESHLRSGRRGAKKPRRIHPVRQCFFGQPVKLYHRPLSQPGRKVLLPQHGLPNPLASLRPNPTALRFPMGFTSITEHSATDGRRAFPSSLSLETLMSTFRNRPPRYMVKTAVCPMGAAATMFRSVSGLSTPLPR